MRRTSHGTEVGELILGTDVVSRLTTILSKDELDTDVRLDVPGDSESGQIFSYRSTDGPSASVGALGLVYVARAPRRQFRTKDRSPNAA